jgi:uncharacterized protein YcnI
MRRLLSRAALIVGGIAVAVLGLGMPASAHVTVSSTSAKQGGYAKLTFRVPNERSDASTVKLEITLPSDAPVASVSVKPVPGWTSSATKSKLATPIKTEDSEISEAVTKITWTATAGGVHPGEFQEFDVSMGPLPAVDQLVFKALQTYSSGEVVRWIDTSAGATHPAPTLKLAPATTAAPTVTAPAAAAGSGDSGDSGSGAGTGLGIAGLVLGAAGLVVALLAYRKAATPR